MEFMELAVWIACSFVFIMLLWASWGFFGWVILRFIFGKSKFSSPWRFVKLGPLYIIILRE